VRCSVVKCGTSSAARDQECCNMVQYDAICCSDFIVLQRCSVYCVVGSSHYRVLQCVTVCCSVLQCVTVCYNVLQCDTVCSNVLQCVTVCVNALQCVLHNTSLFFLYGILCVYVFTSIHSACHGFSHLSSQGLIYA